MKKLLSVDVYVAEPDAVARLYAARLGMRAVRANGARDVIVLAGADDPPFLVLRTLGTLPSDVPAGPGLRRLTCATTTLEADVAWLAARGCATRRTEGRAEAFVPPLGLEVELVEPGSESAPDAMDATGDDAGGDPTAPACLAGAPLDHMAIGVLDAARAAVAFDELLEFRRFDELEVPHATGAARVRLMAQGDPRGFSLALADTDAEGHPFRRQIAERGGPGVHHVAHRVLALEEAIAALEAAGGVVLSDIETSPSLRQVFVSVAPDGLVHELVERSGHDGLVARNTEALVRAEGEWETSTG